MSDYELAHNILGDDFITPMEIVYSGGGVYTGDQLDWFRSVLPSPEVLEWCRENGYTLIPGPNKPMSLLEIRDFKPEYFYSKKSGWYDRPREKFSRFDKAETGWIMIRKEPISGSADKTWNEQKMLYSEMETTPGVAEVAWSVVTYKVVRGKFLLSMPPVYVRVKNQDSTSVRIIIGNFDADGLRVGNMHDQDHDHLTGVASARK